MSDTIHFTPTWTTEGKPCELRNGTLLGTWDPVGIRDVDGHELKPAGLRISLEIGSLDIGSQTRCGTGPWMFSVDGFEVNATAVQCFGLDYARLEVGGIATITSTASGFTLLPSLYGKRVTSVEPWTWSAGDRLSFFVPAESVRVRSHWLFNLPVKG